MFLFPLFVVSALAVGWYAGHKNLLKKVLRSSKKMHTDYFLGLRYVINEQPDKAIDVLINLLDVDGDTVHAHLALGGLFRQRGEVERAIRIHQNIIARPQLTEQHRSQALHELAQDYLHAGVLDRAEKIFLALIEQGSIEKADFLALLQIYQKEKKWVKAIAVAEKLQKKLKDDVSLELSHFWCEQAAFFIEQQSYKKAVQALNSAKLLSSKNGRADLLEASMWSAQGKYEKAICSYQSNLQNSDQYIAEIISPLADAYLALNQPEELLHFSLKLFKNYPRSQDAALFAAQLYEQQGEVAKAIYLLQEFVLFYPSNGVLCHLLRLLLLVVGEGERQNLVRLSHALLKIKDNEQTYHCSLCGFASNALHWQCPSCHQWESFKRKAIIHKRVEVFEHG